MISQARKDELWETSTIFHGHSCPGLAIGYAASLYAADLLNIDLSSVGREEIADEGLVVVAENDACGVDAIQWIFSCTVGKGNLLFHLVGKQAWSFCRRKTGDSVRLVLKTFEQEMERKERIHYLLKTPGKDLFEVKQTSIDLPERAKLFESYPCASCGENAGAQWMRVQDGEKVCLDCFRAYKRLEI